MRGEELSAVMRRFPAGVAVVTVDREGQRLGLTVASLVSLSLEPPLVAISIAQQAALHELLREAGGFAVSLLAAEQERAGAALRPRRAADRDLERRRGRRGDGGAAARRGASAGSRARSQPSTRPATTRSSSGEVERAEPAGRDRRSCGSTAGTDRP